MKGEEILVIISAYPFCWRFIAEENVPHNSPATNTMDVQALKSVENIRKMIAQYREEQERLFTKISPETNKLPPLNFREQSLERLFDHCCLLSISQNSGQMLGTWPIALIGSYSTKGVSLGSFDNHGSLWRFIRVDENHQSIRVVIECSVRE